MLETIDIKLDKLIAEKVQAALNGKLSKKESFSAWRSLLFAICGGAVVAGLNYIFQHL